MSGACRYFRELLTCAESQPAATQATYLKEYLFVCQRAMAPLHDAVFVNRALQILPNATWNYGLLLSSLAFEGGAAIPTLPFDADAPPPVRIMAQARQVPEWKFTTGARGVQPVPKSPLTHSACLWQSQPST